MARLARAAARTRSTTRCFVRNNHGAAHQDDRVVSNQPLGSHGPSWLDDEIYAAQVAIEQRQRARRAARWRFRLEWVVGSTSDPDV